MSPLDRISWLASVAADSGLAAGAHRVAMFLAHAFDSDRGAVAYGTATIARELGIARSTAQAGVYSLARRGWLEASGRPSRGHAATAYRLVCTDRNPGQSTDRTPGRKMPQPTGASVSQPTEQPTDQPTGLAGHYHGDHGDHGIHAASTAPLAAVSSPEFVGPTFVTRLGRPWRLTLPQLRRLQAAHRDVAIEAELEKSALWTEANPTKRKTPQGMLRFVAGWLARAPRATQSNTSDGLPEDDIDRMLAADDLAPAAEVEAHE